MQTKLHFKKTYFMTGNIITETILKTDISNNLVQKCFHPHQEPTIVRPAFSIRKHRPNRSDRKDVFFLDVNL